MGGKRNPLVKCTALSNDASNQRPRLRRERPCQQEEGRGARFSEKHGAGGMWRQELWEVLGSFRRRRSPPSVSMATGSTLLPRSIPCGTLFLSVPSRIWILPAALLVRSVCSLQLCGCLLRWEPKSGPQMEGEIKSETLKCFTALRLSLVKSLREDLLFSLKRRRRGHAKPRQVNRITEAAVPSTRMIILCLPVIALQGEKTCQTFTDSCWSVKLQTCIIIRSRKSGTDGSQAARRRLVCITFSSWRETSKRLD